MKSTINIFFPLILITFLSCKNDIQKVNAQSQEEIGENQPLSKKKYAFAKYLVKSPVLKQKESLNYDSGNFETEHYVEWEEDIYLTDILPIENYNSDSEYLFIDNMEKIVAQKITYKDMEFRGDLTLQVRYVSEIEKLKHHKSKIIDSKFLSFDSYKEASISKRSNENVF